MAWTPLRDRLGLFIHIEISRGGNWQLQHLCCFDIGKNANALPGMRHTSPWVRPWHVSVVVLLPKHHEPFFSSRTAFLSPLVQVWSQVHSPHSHPHLDVSEIVGTKFIIFLHLYFINYTNLRLNVLHIPSHDYHTCKTRPISLISYADAISLLINYTQYGL